MKITGELKFGGNDSNTIISDGAAVHNLSAYLDHLFKILNNKNVEVVYTTNPISIIIRDISQ